MRAENEKSLRRNWKNWSLIEKVTVISSLIGIIAGLSTGIGFGYKYLIKPYIRNEVDHRSIIESYYNSIEDHTFDASNYFTSSVTNFIKMQNTTPSAINDYINSSFYSEFQDPKYEIDGDSFTEEYLDNGDYKISFIEIADCYRKSLAKNQHLKVKTLILFDNEGKILSWQQTDIIENTFTK